ncbi:MAG: hypothetical protein JWQ38_2012 [Flavipsychrobacter sp.]|nr:hypothetical protein [Flavipsychrobacter sp.]
MKPIHLIRSFICYLLFSTLTTNAQMVGSDVFLRGQYLEVGVGDMGQYGTSYSNPSPVGYHPHGLLGRIGFLADPAMDGWTTGTPPYMGDYFVPGTPFEGWALQIGTERALAFGGNTTFDTTSGISGCSGSNISYGISGSVVSSTWQGIIDSVQLTQITYFDTNNLYFNIKVIFTNLAIAPRNNIYYFRTLDPDNDMETFGSFTTTNVLEHQVRDTTVVSAVGLSGPMSYMAMGTTDTNSNALIYQAWPILLTEDLANIYNGTPHLMGTVYYTQGATTTSDIAIGLISYIPHLATVDSASDSVAAKGISTKHLANTATLNYFYAFSPAAVDSAINDQHVTYVTTPPVIPPILEIKNTNSLNEVNVYPNPSKEIVNITGLNTTDQISLYNMMGQMVTDDWRVKKEGTNTFPMNGVATGNYIIVVHDLNGAVKARIPVRKL